MTRLDRTAEGVPAPRTELKGGLPAMVDGRGEVLVLRPGGSAVRLAMWFYGAICLVLLAGVIAGAVRINGQRNPALSVGLAIPLLFMLLFLVFGTGGRCQVTRDSVILKDTRWSHPRVVPLADIAAVGMVYTVQQRINGWRSYLWTADGLAAPLPVGVCVADGPAQSTVADVAASRQGELCRELFQHIVAVQGSG
ncbi:MAG TPA: hypothetical protein VFD94_05795, partial [Jatrophihabitans sp.]|nr:hypothetical protein [Jatrophihabitans sp.]